MVAAQIVVERVEPEAACRGLLVPVGFEVADERRRGISPLFERFRQRRIGVSAAIEAGGRTRGCGQQSRVDEQLGIRRAAVLDLWKHLREVEHARVAGQRVEEWLDFPSVDFETDRPAGLRLHEDENQVFSVRCDSGCLPAVELGIFDEAPGFDPLLLRATPGIGDLVDPVAGPAEVAQGDHRLVAETGPRMVETLRIVSVRGEQDDRGDEQCRSAGCQTSSPACRAGEPSRKEAEQDQACRREQEPPIFATHRIADARAEPVEILPHRVGRERHDASVVAVVPEIREEVEVDDEEPKHHPPSPAEEPCRKGQQHGIRKTPDPHRGVPRVGNLPKGVENREGRQYGKHYRQVIRRPRSERAAHCDGRDMRGFLTAAGHAEAQLAEWVISESGIAARRAIRAAARGPAAGVFRRSAALRA